MTRRRWIADEVLDNRAAITGDHAAHLSRVLRAQVGQEFDVSVEGVVRRGRVVSATQERIEFELHEEIPVPAAASITILLAIFKFDRMEWAIEKCTELGVRKIVPFIARRTDSHLASASAKRIERWRRIAREASEQARRASPPEITPPAKFKDALTMSNGVRIVLSEIEMERSLRNILASDSFQEVTLAIGPEGGWTEDELTSFQDAGWISATIGPTILRAETAAIAATAIVLSNLQYR